MRVPGGVEGSESSYAVAAVTERQLSIAAQARESGLCWCGHPPQLPYCVLGYLGCLRNASKLDSVSSGQPCLKKSC